jgi:hypothetical protein
VSELVPPSPAVPGWAGLPQVRVSSQETSVQAGVCQAVKSRARRKSGVWSERADRVIGIPLSGTNDCRSGLWGGFVEAPRR